MKTDSNEELRARMRELWDKLDEASCPTVASTRVETWISVSLRKPVDHVQAIANFALALDNLCGFAAGGGTEIRMHETGGVFRVYVQTLQDAKRLVYHMLVSGITLEPDGFSLVSKETVEGAHLLEPSEPDQN